MIMALGACDGQSEERGSSGGDTVDDGFDSKLFAIDAAFLIDLCVSVKSGGDQLVSGGVGEEIAGELLGDKLIEGAVFVVCLDHVVAVAPDGSLGIDTIAVGIRVAGKIEPMPAPTFAEMGRREKLINDLFGLAWRMLIEIVVDVGRAGRESDDIEV